VSRPWILDELGLPAFELPTSNRRAVFVASGAGAQLVPILFRAR
jgi:hypothetical protein